MKKISIACRIATIITTSCSLFNLNKEEKFVNPVFYEKLSPVSKNTRPTFLTPTSVTTIDLYGKEDVGRCKMLENTPMFVTLDCTFYVEETKETYSHIVRYVLKGCNEQKEYCFGGKWFVLENESGSAFGTFVIDKKDMGQ